MARENTVVEGRLPGDCMIQIGRCGGGLVIIVDPAKLPAELVHEHGSAHDLALSWLESL